MTTLQDRLADLADDAPPGGPAPDLWERAQRYHRRRRVGTAVIAAAAVVLLAVVAGLGWQRSSPVPSPARGPVGLPDRVWTPSPWLPTVDRPGQLVAISGAEQATWTGRHPAIVGISASSGDYAFIDLPGADLIDGGVELAPDGRHVAYWLTGATTDTPNSRSGPITGLALYDTATGKVTRHLIPTLHGVWPDFLAWADGDTVVFSDGQIRGGDDDPENDQSTSALGTVTSWALGEKPRAVAGLDAGAELQGVAHGRILVGPVRSGPGRRYVLVDVADPRRAHYISVPQISGSVGFLRSVALDRTGSRIALVPGNRSPNRVEAGPVGDLREVPRSERTLGVAGWTDDDTIVTLRYADHGWDRSGLYWVSVSTGASHEIVRFPADTGVGDWQFATDLLDAPSVNGVEPPSPMDPRVTAGLSVAVCLAGAAGMVLWRRRVRA